MQYFGTDGIRGRFGEHPMTPDFALQLGWAAGCMLARRKPMRERHFAYVAHDTRASSPTLTNAFVSGLLYAGIDVGQLDVLPTPAVPCITYETMADAGFMITASHNPHHDNGIKFFDSFGAKFNETAEHNIEELLAQPMAAAPHVGRLEMYDDIEKYYVEFCAKTSDPGVTLDGLRVAVDCANGATYCTAPMVLTALGVTVHAMHNKPDGTNINDQCGSTHPESLVEYVQQSQVNVGIAFDGDGDRVLMVDEGGAVVDGDELLYVIAKMRRDQQRLEGGVVGTVMSNMGLERALGDLGVPFERTPVGDSHIRQRLVEKNWHLGGEPSGHIIPFDLTMTGDGIIATLEVLKAMQTTGRTLAELRSGMRRMPQVTINVALDAGKGAASAPVEQILSKKKVKRTVAELEATLGEHGRILIRPSGTEPVIRVMVEGEGDAEVAQHAETLANAVREASAARA